MEHAAKCQKESRRLSHGSRLPSNSPALGVEDGEILKFHIAHGRSHENGFGSFWAPVVVSNNGCKAAVVGIEAEIPERRSQQAAVGDNRSQSRR